MCNCIHWPTTEDKLRTTLNIGTRMYSVFSSLVHVIYLWSVYLLYIRGCVSSVRSQKFPDTLGERGTMNWYSLDWVLLLLRANVLCHRHNFPIDTVVKLTLHLHHNQLAAHGLQLKKLTNLLQGLRSILNSIACTQNLTKLFSFPLFYIGNGVYTGTAMRYLAVL